uniref:Uncharacterized protein n=1 Tax=Meloidogyne hapla TaxID=6305 RepID=A0A1I8BGN0_MELHA
MVHIIFDTSTVSYDNFQPNELTRNGITDEYNYFRGAPPFQRGYGQRGAGVGDVMRGLWRFIRPIIQRVGSTVSAEALNTGQRVLERVNKGEPIKEALVSEGRKGIDTVLEKGGFPKQFGTGGKKSIKRKRELEKLHQTLIKRKRLRKDAFESINSITNALDFFHVPPTNVSISSSKVFEILTSNPLTDTPYHFKIHSSSNYIDLSKCYLLTEFRIRKENAAGQLVNLTLDENVAPIQMIGKTFINNMRVSVNGQEIFNSNSLYAYKTYLSHELSYSAGAKSSHLNSAGYYYDTGTDQQLGSSFTSRKSLFTQSRTAQFVSKLDADIFNQPLYLINHLVSCKLYVKKVELMDGLALDITRKLDTKPARYAVRKTLMKQLFITQGRYEFNSNIFMDKIPRRIILGLVSNSDYVGAVERSPFNFQHFNVREISIIANGRSYPQAPYDLDYKNFKYARPFNDMNDALGFANSCESNGITYQQFGQNSCIYVFNLTNSGEDQGDTFDLIKNGTTSVSIKFNQPVLEGGAMLIVMGEADSLIMLDKNRTIATLFFAPCSNSLFKDTDVNLENLPEYSEFIKQLKPSTTPLPLIIGFPNGNLPTIQLCKESPGDDLYGHIFCWGMIGLYFVLILSLIVYQLRSFFWVIFQRKRYNNSDVQQSNIENFELKPLNESTISGLFSV